MRLKLSLHRPPGQPHPPVDLLVTVDTTVTVGELAAAIGERDPLAPLKIPAEGVTLALQDGGTQKPIRHDATVADAGLRSGQAISVVKRRPAAQEAEVTDSAAVLVVVDGPNAGKELPLPAGVSYIGRAADSTVQLDDPMVSNRHARVVVTDVVEIVDLGSSNGVLVHDEPVTRAILGPDDPVLLGGTVVRIIRRGGVALSGAPPTVEFNRSPRLDPVYEGLELEAPEVPTPPDRARISIAAMVAPILMGGVMYLITKNAFSVLFLAMSPVLMVGSVIEQRILGRRALVEAIAAFRAALVDLRKELAEARATEVAVRQAEHPAIAHALEAVSQRSNLLWTRRPDRRAFLEVRLGGARLPSRTAVKLPTRGKALPELWAEAVAVRDEFRHVEPVPAVVGFQEHRSVGVAGPRDRALDVARSIVTQLTALHSPSEVVIAGALSGSTAAEWEWLKWLPHVTSDHSPLGGDAVASSPAPLLRLVNELEDLLDHRSSDARDAADATPAQLPAIVVLVEDDAPIERSRLVELAERGPDHRIHLLWIGGAVTRLPAACGAFVDTAVNAPGLALLGYTTTGEPALPVAVETVSAPTAAAMARQLSPMVDAGARVDDDSDLPRSVSLLSITGSDEAARPDAVLDRWRSSGSLPSREGDSPKGRRREHHLRSVIGLSAGQNLVLDLREHGPHALVGGTTGSGKSEFLQSWVISIAAEHSPSRVTFLFVDYKGGAAFADCTSLPHCVGLVTDLSPHLVQRALRSLKAELRWREKLLERKRAKDLLELEKRGDPETPPSLIIMVDEFAALVSEVPEFVDGVVDVAQRGRSLGLHLVLATQNPGQSIKDNLRANTNLRIALRMNDPEHSLDVIGTNQAALFDPGIPGRAIVKTGAGRLTPFQTGYVGGHTSDTPPPPIIELEEWRVSERSPWEAATAVEVPAPSGPNDLKRLVRTIRAAHASAFTQPGDDGSPTVKLPRRPWLDDLATVYDLARTPQSRTDEELIFGILDDPDTQSQRPVAFRPDADGHMAIFGTGGTGKSVVLRTLGIVAGLSMRGGPCHVYGIDFGTRSLQMLEPLPHVGAVVNQDDEERLQRLLVRLRDMIDDRARRYAAVNASTITQYRDLADQPDEPRILLLVDGVGAFRDAYESGPQFRLWDLFQGIVADGRPVGVHVVVTADRAAAVSAALSSMIQQRLVLRLASENEFSTLGVAPEVFGLDSPPGRGVFQGFDVQVAVLGGTSNTAHQAAAIRRLAQQLKDSEGASRFRARGIERLPERVSLFELPSVVEGLPALGIGYDALTPLGFDADDLLVVTGPPQSGRTSVMAALAQSLKRAGRERLVYFGGGRSVLAGAVPWHREATEDEGMVDLAEELASSVGTPSGPDAVFLEDFPGFTPYGVTEPLEALITACKRTGIPVIADADSSELTASPLYRVLLGARHGIVLQPDPFDGENLFKTPLPRFQKSEMPPGRGFYLRGGKTWRVQCALPELGVASDA